MGWESTTVTVFNFLYSCRQSVEILFFGANNMKVRNYVSTGSINSIFTSYRFSFSRMDLVLGAALYCAQCTGRISAVANSIGCFAMLMPPRSPLQMDLNFCMIPMNLSLEFSNLGSIFTFCLQSCPRSRHLHVQLSHDACFASSDLVFPCSIRC